jgi:hypothetical protein
MPSPTPVSHAEAQRSPAKPSPTPVAYVEAQRSPASHSPALVNHAETRQTPAKPSPTPVSHAETQRTPAKPSAAPVAYVEARQTPAKPSPEFASSRAKPLPKDKTYAEGETQGDALMLSLFVEDQNTAIGRRNIHSVKAGNSFSIGGGKSDFLIFLVPIPPNIAELKYDGRNCTLIPKKPKYFPDLGSQQSPNCIGKNIRVLSDRNFELHIRIEKYEDPLHSLNRLLSSITVPGEKRA